MDILWTCIPGLMNYMMCISDSDGTVLQAKYGNQANLTSGDNLVVPTHADGMLVFTYAST